MLGMPDWTVASCFIATAVTVSVDAVSGLSVTAAMVLTTFAAVANVRALWLNTSTLVVPASTPTRGTTGHTHRWSYPSGPEVLFAALSRFTLPLQVTALSSYACH